MSNAPLVRIAAATFMLVATACDGGSNPDEAGDTSTGAAATGGPEPGSSAESGAGGTTGPSTTGTSASAEDSTGTPSGDGSASTSGDAGSGPGEEGGEDAGETSAPSDPSAPVILSLSTSGAVIQGDELIVSAVVTDPDGIDDVIGGQLQDEDGDVLLGTFSSGAQEGAYQVSVPFHDLFALDPEDGSTPVERTLRVTFFDQGGSTAVEDVAVELECYAGFACDGTCGTASSECHPVFGPGCAAGENCHAYTIGYFICWPGGGASEGEACTGVYDCDFGLDCVSGACRNFCNDSAPCPAGFTCEPLGFSGLCSDDGRCVPS